MQSSVSSLVFLLLSWGVSALALVITGYLVRGFKVSSFVAALFAAAAISAANALIRPVLLFLTLPFNIVTFGLFTFVVNGMVLKICALFIPGFRVETWSAAIFGSFVLALLSTLLHFILI